jgi:hypothetical protein
MKRLPLSLILAVFLFGGVVKSAETAVMYDGKWWLSVSKEQRLGFFEGYATCYLNDTNGKVRFTESGYAYEPRLTSYLEQNPKENAASIEELLWKMATPLYAQSITRLPGSGEKSKGKYGYLDGDYWRQSKDVKRIGLIQGFLYCYSRSVKAPAGTFSKPPLYYVKSISKWYGVKKDDPSEITPNRIATKIPNVLFRFRDGHSQH